MSWGEWRGLHRARTQTQATPLHIDMHSHQQVCTHVYTHTHTQDHIYVHTHIVNPHQMLLWQGAIPDSF